MSQSRYSLLYLILYSLLISGCSILPADINKNTSFSYLDTQTTRLGKIAASLNKQQNNISGILPLASGIDAFTARYLLAKNADRSIDVQYYIWHNDTTGKLLAYALLKAAERGVRVRVLLDDINTSQKDGVLLSLNAHKNIEVRVFNPFPNRTARFFDLITDFFRVNRRMHNKSFTIDNQVTIVGGRNIGDEYFEADPAMDFHDFDIMTIGNVVSDVSNQFDEYWNHKYAYPINSLSIYEEQIPADVLKRKLEAFFLESYKTPYIQAVKKSEFISRLKNKTLKLYWDEARLFYDPPDKIRPEDDNHSEYLLPQLTPYIDSSSDEVILISAYFIPGRKGMKYIRSLTERGVSVKALTNSLASTDVPIVYSGYARYRIPLLEYGVDLYEIKTTARSQFSHTQKEKRSFSGSSRSSLHSKVYVFDRQNLFIGSFNLDPRSSKLNTEMGVMIFNTELASSIGQWWDKNINQVAYKLGVETIEDEYEEEDYVYWLDLTAEPVIRYDEPPKADLLQMIGSDVFSIFPIEDHL
jgi:putative cardiolipin synthase